VKDGQIEKLELELSQVGKELDKSKCELITSQEALEACHNSKSELKVNLEG